MYQCVERKSDLLNDGEVSGDPREVVQVAQHGARGAAVQQAVRQAGRGAGRQAGRGGRGGAPLHARAARAQHRGLALPGETGARERILQIFFNSLIDLRSTTISPDVK